MILRAKVAVEGYAKGPALVVREPISLFGDIDAKRGRLLRTGDVIAGRILCFPHGRGSTVGSYVLYYLKKRNKHPLAIINEKADPVVVIGAILAEIPMLYDIKIEEIKTGDLLEIDASTGMIRILGERKCI